MSSRANFVLRFSSLGDIVLCSALAQKLCTEDPQALNYFVTNKSFKTFVKHSFPCHELKVLSVEKGVLSYFFSGIKIAYQMQKKYKELREINLYDLHRVSKSAAWIRGFRLMSLFVKRFHTKLLQSEKHSLKRNLSIWRKKDLLGKRFVYLDHLKIAPGNNNYHPQLIHKKNDSLRNKILIAPDSAKWKKKWLTQHWEELFRLLLKSEKNYSITLVGGNKCLPIDLVDEFEDIATGRFENKLGKTRVDELAQIAAEHQLTICGNSAWLHISEAVNTPVISLAGPIVPGFGFSPWQHRSVELSVDLPCRPCSKHGGGLCTQRGENFHACMKKITANKVFSEVEKQFS